MENNKKSIPKILLGISIVTIIIILSLIVSIKLLKNNFNIIELFNNKKIEYYKEKLANKYNVDIQELEFVSFKKEHKEKRGGGVWFGTKEVTVPDFIKFKYRDKVITVFGDNDDYYYDELIEEVEQYYCKILNVNKVVVRADTSIGDDSLCSTVYARYLMENNLQAINENIVKDFINNSNIETIYIEAPNDNVEEFVRKIIDNMSILDKFVSITLVSEIEKITTYREQPNYYYFDYYYIKGVNDIKTYTRITNEKGADKKYYNGYYYSEINYDVNMER